VDKSKHDPAVAFSQQAMLFSQGFDESAHPIDEALSAIPIVVDVDLDVGHAQACHFGEGLEKLRSIFFLRIEEGIAGRTSSRVAMSSGDAWPLSTPRCHSVHRRLGVGAPPERLEVVSDCYPRDAWWPFRQALKAIAQ